jgi:hypothetical protein
MVKGEHHPAAGRPAQEEVRELLRLMWRRTGLPVAKDNADFIRYIRECLDTKRDNRDIATAPPSVFLFHDKGGPVIVTHATTLRAWHSTSQFKNHRYSEEEIRKGLLLLRASYRMNFTRWHEGEFETASVWLIPLDVLADADEEDEKE